MPAKKVDANQPEITEALRKIGASVLILSDVGKGCPDILVGWRGVNYLMEIKDGDKVLSKRRLTPDEDIFHNTWDGQVATVECIEDAFIEIGITFNR